CQHQTEQLALKCLSWILKRPAWRSFMEEVENIRVVFRASYNLGYVWMQVVGILEVNSDADENDDDDDMMMMNMIMYRNFAYCYCYIRSIVINASTEILVFIKFN
ncbi:hypothetical protein GQX74_009221, partial [Glossina fuscipes]